MILDLFAGPGGWSEGLRQLGLRDIGVEVDLQGFRPDYPWQGTKTAQFSQVGNAVPPPMAAAIIRALRVQSHP